MKRISAKLLLFLVCILTLLSTSVFAENRANAASNEVVNVIKLLEIANGDQYGNMNYDKNVTRAEFVKMAINASPSKETAANIKLNISLFPDVKNNYWGAGYISVAINDGLVNGYLDGTFKPGNNVTLEEAVTIVLRLLGYTDSDLVGGYPSAQLSKYKDIKLNENLTAVKGDLLTREECMILLYNALNAKTKFGQTYCTTLGYGTNSDGKIDYSALLENELEGPIIVTNKEEVFKNTSFTPNEETAYLLNNIDASETDINIGDAVYYSDILNSVFIYRKTATGIVNSSNSAAVTLSGKTYSIATTTAKDKLSLGGKFHEEKSFVTLVLGLNDEVGDVVEGSVSDIEANKDNSTLLEMINATVSLPIHLKSQSDIDSLPDKIPFDLNDADVFVNGKTVDSVNFGLNDVVYFSKPFNSVWIFRETKSGILHAANSNSILVGDATYILATNDAKLKVSTYGQYNVDDYITLILGKDDEVIDIVDANTSNIGNTDNDSSYSEVVSSTLKGPYVVGENGEMDNLKIDKDTCKVFHESVEIDPSHILPNDVYYFSDVLDTIWIYRDKVSGTIEDIYPSSSPVSVTVSGKTYKVTSSQASYDLSSFGKFNVGDRVTLLLGMDDDVAYVKSASDLSSVVYGIITAKGEKTFTDKYGDSYTANFVTVTDTKAVSRTYEYGHNRYNVGDVVRVVVGDTVQISMINEQIGKSEALRIISAIKNGDFSENCEIIDVNGSNVIKVLPSRISGCDLELEQFNYSTIVLYYEFENNKLSKLVLNNFTGDFYDYGIVVSSKAGYVDYRIDAVERSFTSASGSSCSPGPAKFKKENGAIVSASALTGYIDDIDMVTNTAIYDKNKNEYQLDENVCVFIKETNTTYKYVDLENVANDEYSLKAYYDKLPKYGGKIRVIIATKNY